MRTFICLVCLCWSPAVLSAVEAAPAAVIARGYLATGDIATLNRIFGLPMDARRPAVDVLLPVLVPGSPRPVLERAFALLRCLDARGPATIAALRPFLVAGQPMQVNAMLAIEALGHDGEPLISDLLALLTSGNRFASRALSSIGRHGDVVVPALLAALHGRDGRADRSVIAALGNPAWALQAERIVPALVAIVAAPEPPSDPDEMSFGPVESLRSCAAIALSQLGWQAVPTLPVLLTVLDSDDRAARPGVLYALGFVGPGAAAAVPRLITLLREPPPPAQDVTRLNERSELLSACRALGPLAAQASPLLVGLALSGDEQSSSACAALEAIGNLSAADAARVLAAGEADHQNGERFLGLLRGPGGAAAATLLARWATADAPAREHLGHYLAYQAVAPLPTPALLALTRHQDPIIRRFVLGYLADCRPRPSWVADELDAHNAEDAELWLLAIAADPPRCSRWLNELIALTRKPTQASSAAYAISRAAPLGHAQIELLRAHLADADLGLRLASACALGQALSPVEQVAVRAAALSAWEGPTFECRSLAATVLSVLPADPTSARVLRQQFDAGDFSIRITLLAALVQQLPAADGADLLNGLLTEPAYNLTRLACELLAVHGPAGRRALPRLHELAWAPQNPYAGDAWCVLAALDLDDQEALGHAAQQAWYSRWEDRLTALAALHARPVAVPALRQLGELLAQDPDGEIAAAGRVLANQSR